MKIPSDAIIPEAKITRYLVVFQEESDKSKFLAQAGFTQDNPQDLIAAIRQHVEAVEALADRESEYGTFYRTEGTLVGPNGVSLPVFTIWLDSRSDQHFRFVTLKPRKESHRGT